MNQKLSEIHETLSEKDRIDTEQTQRLEELGALLENKDSVDQKQEEAISANKNAIAKNAEAIKVLFEYIKQKDVLDKEQSAKIEAIKKISNRKLCVIAIVVSVISFAVSITSIILGFIK